jgi:hypothetical protein
VTTILKSSHLFSATPTSDTLNPQNGTLSYDERSTRPAVFLNFDAHRMSLSDTAYECCVACVGWRENVGRKCDRDADYTHSTVPTPFCWGSSIASCVLNLPLDIFLFCTFPFSRISAWLKPTQICSPLQLSKTQVEARTKKEK